MMKYGNISIRYYAYIDRSVRFRAFRWHRRRCTRAFQSSKCPREPVGLLNLQVCTLKASSQTWKQKKVLTRGFSGSNIEHREQWQLLRSAVPNGKRKRIFSIFIFDSYFLWISLFSCEKVDRWRLWASIRESLSRIRFEIRFLFDSTKRVRK